jgi:hypothetical protein
MRHPSRLPCALVLGAVLLGQGSALSQPAPETAPPEQPQPDQAAPEVERPDPPALVGRVARLDGNSQYRLPGQESWQPARVNFPVTTGHAIWTGPQARAGLQLGSLRLALESDSRVEFAQADDGALHLVLAQGMLFLAVPAGGPALPIRITTPRGDAILPGPGQLLVQAGAEDRPTRIALLAGRGSVEAEGLEPLALAAGQAVALVGTAPPQAQRESAGPPPPLVAWAQRQEPRGNLPAAVAGMTGADDLSHYGEWQQSQEYGDLWVPPVPQGWAPYRQGHWAFVEPWGWNWVDDAPWGFAPFHYGRWVEWAGGWAWAPGYGNAGYWPVYAPALVTFFPGVRLEWLGWAPLRPWQAYQPPYWVSLPWFRRLNHGQVRDWAGTEAWWHQHRFAPPPGSFHTAGATLVPAASFAGGRPVTPFAQAHNGAIAGPVLARPGLAPVLAAGVGAALLAPRALALARPPLPPALGARPAAPPAFRAGLPAPGLGPLPPAGSGPLPPAGPGRTPPANFGLAGKPPALGGAPGGAPGLGGKPGGYGGAPPGGYSRPPANGMLPASPAAGAAPLARRLAAKAMRASPVAAGAARRQAVTIRHRRPATSAPRPRISARRRRPRPITRRATGPRRPASMRRLPLRARRRLPRRTMAVAITAASAGPAGQRDRWSRHPRRYLSGSQTSRLRPLPTGS